MLRPLMASTQVRSNRPNESGSLSGARDRIVILTDACGNRSLLCSIPTSPGQIVLAETPVVYTRVPTQDDFAPAEQLAKLLLRDQRLLARYLSLGLKSNHSFARLAEQRSYGIWCASIAGVGWFKVFLSVCTNRSVHLDGASPASASTPLASRITMCTEHGSSRPRI